MDSIVVDKTGLTGRYDVDLKWNPSEAEGTDPSAPSIFAAVQDQLGLRLKPTKTTEETIVIDRLDMPSGN